MLNFTGFNYLQNFVLYNPELYFCPKTLYLYNLQAWGMCNVYLEPDIILERGLKDLEFENVFQNNNHN